MRLAIFGTGGMGRELADVALRSPLVGSKYDQIIFVTDGAETSVMGVPVIRPTDLRQTDELCFAVGDSRSRRSLAQRFAGKALATVVSADAIISQSAIIGAGSMLADLTLVNNGVRIGRHFLGNAGSQLSHDCLVGDFVTLSPRAVCNGWVHLEDEVFIGAGAIVRNGSAKRRLRIGAGAVIGMGAVVVDDVPEGATVIGIPARPLGNSVSDSADFISEPPEH